MLYSGAAGVPSERPPEEAEGKKRDSKERLKGVKVSQLVAFRLLYRIARFVRLSDVS